MTIYVLIYTFIYVLFLCAKPHIKLDLSKCLKRGLTTALPYLKKKKPKV